MQAQAANFAANRAAMIASATDQALKPAPIEPSWIRGGNPEARNAVLSRSADGTATTILWDCTSGEFDWIYDIDETLYFIEGSATIGDGHAPPRLFTAGDVLFLPHGTVAHWQIDRYVRKVAFCRRTLPQPIAFGLRAGRKLKRVLTPALSVWAGGSKGAAAPAWSGGL